MAMPQQPPWPQARQPQAPQQFAYPPPPSRSPGSRLRWFHLAAATLAGVAAIALTLMLFVDYSESVSSYSDETTTYTRTLWGMTVDPPDPDYDPAAARVGIVYTILAVLLFSGVGASLAALAPKASSRLPGAARMLLVSASTAVISLALLSLIYQLANQSNNDASYSDNALAGFWLEMSAGILCLLALICSLITALERHPGHRSMRQ